MRRFLATVVLSACIGGTADARVSVRTPAIGVWNTSFDKRAGQTIAAFHGAGGERLAFICDSAGPRPGRGALVITIPLSQAPDPLPPAIGITIQGAQQALTFAARTRLETHVAKTEKNRTAGKSAESYLLTLSFMLDGSALAAQKMADSVSVVRHEKSSTIRVAELPLEFMVTNSNHQRALAGFDKGCQNFLPAADDEVIWDWHQGLDMIDEKRSITLVAQSVLHGTRDHAPRLSIHCHAQALTMTMTGIAASQSDGHVIVTGHAADGDEPIAEVKIGFRRSSDPHVAMLESEHFPPLLALLRQADAISLRPEHASQQDSKMPVAGFTLASRLLGQHCPSASP